MRKTKDLFGSISDFFMNFPSTPLYKTANLLLQSKSRFFDGEAACAAGGLYAEFFDPISRGAFLTFEEIMYDEISRLSSSQISSMV